MAANLGFRQRTGEHMGRRSAAAAGFDPAKKKKVSSADAWREARELLWAHRRRLTLGLALMLVSRLAGLVLPASSKYLIDETPVIDSATLRYSRCTPFVKTSSSRFSAV